MTDKKTCLIWQVFYCWLGKFSHNIKMSIYPNPVRDVTTLKLYTDKAQDAVISITDIYGRNLLKQQNKINSGYKQIVLSTRNLASGGYYISIKKAIEINPLKFTK